MFLKNNALLFSNTTKFWSFLLIFIPSISCSVLTLYYLLSNRHRRNTINNHVIIIVLFIGFVYQMTIYPWMIYYYYMNGLWNRTVVFCSIWAFIDWVFYILQTMLFAWATLERHLLIFHHRCLATRRNRLYFHYFPICILIFYCLIFYTIVDFFPACRNSFNNTYLRCVYFCINDSCPFYLWETIVHQMIPGLIIFLCSLSLFVRVIWKRSHIHRPIQWRKYRKMTREVLSISLLYLLFYFPYTILNVMHLFGFVYNSNPTLTDSLDFFSYFMMLFLPFVCALTLPKSGNSLCLRKYKRRL